MSRSHGPDEFLDPRDTSAEAIPRPRQADRPKLIAGARPRERLARGCSANAEPCAEPTQPRSAEPREAFEVRGETYRLRLFRNSDPHRAWEVSRRCDSRTYTNSRTRGTKARAIVDVQEPHSPRSRLSTENSTFRHQSAAPADVDEAGSSGFCSPRSAFRRIRLFTTASPSRVKPTTMPTCTGCITPQPERSNAGWAKSPRDS